MAVNLTQDALKTMCFTSEELQPVLQVFDLKLVQPQQNCSTERYRAVLSDGSFYQQGMVATQKNHLVQSGILQKGSIVKLSQYVCNDVQGRKIIIVVDFDILLHKCDLIGNPVALPNEAPAQSGVTRVGNVQPASGQLGNSAGNSQYVNNNSHAGGVNVRPNVAVPSIDRLKVNPAARSVYSNSNSSDSARYGASNCPPLYPKPTPTSSAEPLKTHQIPYSFIFDNKPNIELLRNLIFNDLIRLYPWKNKFVVKLPEFCDEFAAVKAKITDAMDMLEQLWMKEIKKNQPGRVNELVEDMECPEVKRFTYHPRIFPENNEEHVRSEIDKSIAAKIAVLKVQGQQGKNIVTTEGNKEKEFVLGECGQEKSSMDIDQIVLQDKNQSEPEGSAQRIQEELALQKIKQEALEAKVSAIAEDQKEMKKNQKTMDGKLDSVNQNLLTILALLSAKNP